MPGFSFASAISSGSVFTGILLFMMRMKGAVPMTPTGMKSAIGSKVRLRYSEGIIDVAELATYSM